MKYLFNLSYALVITFILTAFTLAQEPEKPKVVMTQQAPKMVSLGTLAAGEKFTSPEGRFTIALPTDIAQFEALKPNEESPKETGGQYSWVVKEGVITINYSDDPDLVVKTEKDYADLAEGMKAGITAFGATVLSEKVIRVGDYRGYEIRFESTEKLKGLSRMLIVGGRKYAVFCLAFPDAPGGAELLNRAMDTFELISDNAKPKPPLVKKKPRNLHESTRIRTGPSIQNQNTIIRSILSSL